MCFLQARLWLYIIPRNLLVSFIMFELCDAWCYRFRLRCTYPHLDSFPTSQAPTSFWWSGRGGCHWQKGRCHRQTHTLEVHWCMQEIEYYALFSCFTSDRTSASVDVSPSSLRFAENDPQLIPMYLFGIVILQKYNSMPLCLFRFPFRLNMLGCPAIRFIERHHILTSWHVIWAFC